MNINELRESWLLPIIIMAGISIAVITAALWTTEPTQPAEATPACLTTTDLNRDDLGAVITLTRFCEGLGLQSNIYWQTDDQNNVYGIPICTQPQEGTQ